MSWDPAREAHDRSEREPRVAKLVAVEISSDRLARVRVIVRNLSAHGIGARGECNVLPCERVTVHFPDGSAVGATVRWVRKGSFGVALDERIEPSAVQTKAAAGRLVPRDAEVTFERYRHYSTASRAGFSRSHRDEVLKVGGNWQGNKRDSDWT